jgi:hypothetical protein
MKGLYLTQEGKQEIEAKIAELEKPEFHWDGIYVSEKAEERIEVYKEILSSATILPVEESWNQFNMSNNSLTLENKKIWYPNGVIIQPKQ